MNSENYVSIIELIIENGKFTKECLASLQAAEGLAQYYENICADVVNYRVKVAHLIQSESKGQKYEYEDILRMLNQEGFNTENFVIPFKGSMTGVAFKKWHDNHHSGDVVLVKTFSHLATGWIK